MGDGRRFSVEGVFDQRLGCGATGSGDLLRDRNLVGTAFGKAANILVLSEGF